MPDSKPTFQMAKAKQEVKPLKAVFQVTSTSPTEGLVRLEPINDLAGTNQSFSAGDPKGVIEMVVSNQEAQGYFESGKAFEVVFTPVAQ